MTGLSLRHEIVNGHRIAVYEAGEGPAVLLIHGIPDSAATWRHLTGPLLDAGYRVIALDLLGAGQSDMAPCPADYARQFEVAAAWAAVESSGVEKLHAVVGHDRGAPIAWIMAATAPERVERLVALSVGHPASFSRQDMQQRQMQWHALRFQFPDAEAFVRQDDFKFFREWMYDHPDTDVWIANLSRAGAVNAMLNFYRANLNPVNRPTGRLAEVTIPVTGIWSDGDPYLAEAQMKNSDEFVTGPWTYVRIDGAGHFLHLDAPQAVNAAIITALDTGVP